ncbi:hypothetical protein SpCBS45565_g05151 [Spizellomyces sp. 'palustris']|nr:hypothetical protein SpCBS45565_g05151 [Spizellomyces sp. 'palustris']
MPHHQSPYVKTRPSMGQPRQVPLNETPQQHPSTSGNVPRDLVEAGLHTKYTSAIFERRIEFREVRKPDIAQDALRRKYKPINLERFPTELKVSAGGTCSIGDKVDAKADGDPLEPPPRVLFDKRLLQHQWLKFWAAGPGLYNTGTYCYMNAALQPLIHTRLFVNSCIDKLHSKTCRMSGVCFLCKIEEYVIQNCVAAEGRSRNSVLNPKYFTKNIKLICRDFRYGKQEDAHEFLRCLMDKFQDSCLHGMKNLDHRTKTTTLIHQIFGGYTRSQIRCSQCQHKSNTYEPMLDMSLEVCSYLQKAFALHTKTEKLEGDNKYKCDRCKTLVDAQKRISIEVAPEVLTVQLKRFDVFGRGKNNTKVEFPECLDLTASMTSRQQRTRYQLYAMIAHHGSSPNHGHYTAFAKDPNGTWHYYDDEDVTQSKLESVLAKKSQAYMLFYALLHEEPAPVAGAAGKVKRAEKKELLKVVKPQRDDMGVKISREEANKKRKKKTASPLAIVKNVQNVSQPDRSSPPKPSGPEAPAPIAPTPATSATTSNTPAISQVNQSTIPASVLKPASPPKRRRSTDEEDDLTVQDLVDTARSSKRPKTSPLPAVPADIPHPVPLDIQYNAPIAQWGGMDVHMERVRRDRVLDLSKTKLKRPARDDLEYDMGRVKKAKVKGEGKGTVGMKRTG